MVAAVVRKDAIERVRRLSDELLRIEAESERTKTELFSAILAAYAMGAGVAELAQAASVGMVDDAFLDALVNLVGGRASGET
jgi:hypothetical protein